MSIKTYDYKKTPAGKRVLPFNEIESRNLTHGQGVNRIWLSNSSENFSTPTDKIYYCLQIIKDATFTHLFDRLNYEDDDTFIDIADTGMPLADAPIPAGTVLFGWFKNITIVEGIICAFEII